LAKPSRRAFASAAEWDRMFNVNVRYPFFGTRTGVPTMKQAGGGSIINILSIYGR
jgi:NAD(P)-dependent dehydrogenase (short-subunit alcohol dehydrogenase family)